MTTFNARAVRAALPAAALLLAASTLSACNNAKRDADLLAKEGRGHAAVISRALGSLDAASTETRDKNADAFGNALAPPEKGSKDDEKAVDWSSPSEVVVVYKSSHDEIDSTPEAKRVSQKLRSMGTPGLNISTGGMSGGWTAVPEGMKRKVWDQLSVKPGGQGQKLVWTPERVKKIIPAAEELKAKFSNACDGLAKTAAAGGGALLEKCRSGERAAAQLLDAAREVSKAQDASTGEAKPEQSAVQGAVEKMLKARAELRDAVSGYDAALKELAAVAAR